MSEVSSYWTAKAAPLRSADGHQALVLARVAGDQDVIQARARQLAGITDVSVYALNPTTALGLGLAIDYSLFIVACYREEPRAGREPAALPMYFLHSMGCAGIAPTARRVIPSRRPS